MPQRYFCCLFNRLGGLNTHSFFSYAREIYTRTSLNTCIYIHTRIRTYVCTLFALFLSFDRRSSLPYDCVYVVIVVFVVVVSSFYFTFYISSAICYWNYITKLSSSFFVKICEKKRPNNKGTEGGDKGLLHWENRGTKREPDTKHRTEQNRTE